METKPIPTHPDYGATTDGHILNRNGMVLRTYECNGYKRISLAKPNGKRMGIDVHRLVYTAFNGPLPTSTLVTHINGDRQDNRLENLTTISRSEYFKTHRRKTPAEWELKRKVAYQMQDHGYSQADIATALSCSRAYVSQLLSKRPE